MEIGITGLPSSGKTVVFNALSRAKVPVATYSTVTSEPNRAVVKVPDARLAALRELFSPRKYTPAEVRYVDVAGVTQGTSNDNQAAQLLALLRNTDELVIVLRGFSNGTVAHPLGSIDAERDMEIVSTELLLSDLSVTEKRLERLDKEVQHGKGTETERQQREREHSALKRIQAAVAEGHPARSVELDSEDEKLLRGYGFLTRKPWLILLNSDDEGADQEVLGRLKAHWQDSGTDVAAIAGRLEMDLAELSPEEAAEFLSAWDVAEPALDRVIQLSYRLLDLVSFFTVGEDEVRAWTVHRGATSVDAASEIHSSIGRAFIRAEVIRHDELLACRTYVEARKQGLLRSEGRTYIIQDGDIAHFLHSA